jgi:hypothetical protein
MILACTSIVGWNNHSQAASKAVWEYKILNSAVEPPQVPMGDHERGLNQLGADGWELVQFSRSEISETRGIWIFRRAK